MEAGNRDKKPVVSVHWYRHGLRVHDNPALHASLDGTDEFYPIFIFDGAVAGTFNAAYPRMKFLYESLKDLDNSFQEAGGRLIVLHGDPCKVLTGLFKEWGVTRLTFEQDPEPLWMERDNKVKALCEKEGVEWIEKVSHTLWNPKEISEANGGRPPHTYKLFQVVSSSLNPPPRPLQQPDFSKVKLPLPNQYMDSFGLPSMKELGIVPDNDKQEQPCQEWKGGEATGLEHLQKRVKHEIKAFKKGILLPNQYAPDLIGKSKSMSPHLRFGTVSVRKMYYMLCDGYKKIHGKDEPGVTAQLIWREYFYCMSYDNINFARMEDNPICLQINWNKDEEMLKKWSEGETGYPWIDACMRQLVQEGWVHHVGRHAVACFLTRGDLWISWVDGLQVYLRYLLDGDWSVAAGNWMWVSSSAFENCLQCPQCYSPVLYGMKMDPKGEYVRRYVPELKDMPLKYLFQPWKAPINVQKDAKCIIGEDYPKPMVDHKEAWSKCKAYMEEVKAIVKDPDIWHCQPSDNLEAREFTGLPGGGTGDACNSSLTCNSISMLM